MTSQLYYTAPSDKIFDEVKQASMKLWHEVDTDGDKYGYASEKINQIQHLKNVSDNLMYIVSMFDISNQARLSSMLSDEARKAIAERLAAGGQPEYLNPFRSNGEMEKER